MTTRDELIQVAARAIDSCSPDGLTGDWQTWRKEATAALDAILEGMRGVFNEEGEWHAIRRFLGYQDLLDALKAEVETA